MVNYIMVKEILDRTYNYGYNRVHYSVLGEMKIMGRPWGITEAVIERVYQKGTEDRVNNG